MNTIVTHRTEAMVVASPAIVQSAVNSLEHRTGSTVMITVAPTEGASPGFPARTWFRGPTSDVMSVLGEIAAMGEAVPFTAYPIGS